LGTFVRYHRAMAAPASSETLSSREADVLRLVACGMTNREVGAALQISERTVNNHLRRIYAKLSIRDRTQAALVAILRGLVPYDLRRHRWNDVGAGRVARCE
ncbi:MAG TPA: response regulator transcription factor, partial [Chloroflexota bacterium]